MEKEKGRERKRVKKGGRKKERGREKNREEEGGRRWKKVEESIREYTLFYRRELGIWNIAVESIR